MIQVDNNGLGIAWKSERPKDVQEMKILQMFVLSIKQYIEVL